MKKVITGLLLFIICSGIVTNALPYSLNIQLMIDNDTYAVPKTGLNIKTDGILTEEFWSDALVLELIYEVEPGENILPPVQTEVLITYNETHLFVGFKAYDSLPSEIQAHHSDRDNLYSDDWVGIILDTYNDERRSFDFICNPLGIQADAIETPGNYQDEWDAIWDSHGRITKEGFVVEMSIPFSSLRFQRTDGKQTWGFDAVRSYPRSVRHLIGVFPRDRNNNCYLCQSVKIEGFEGAKPGKNIEIVPAVVWQLSQERNDETGEMEWENNELQPGITAKYGFANNLTFSGTINPDFSQVEADAPQLDINEPFALYFPEKRPFFTEGVDFFDTQIDAVYTRTIREPIWGAKITGKERANTIGAFIAQDDITNLIFPGSQGSSDASLSINSTAGVIRYARDFGNTYKLGFLATDREAKDYYNRYIGIDQDIRITEKDRILFSMAGTGTKYPTSIADSNSQPKGEFQDYALNFTYFHNTRNLDWRIGYKDFGEKFRADLGYIPQVNFKEMTAVTEYVVLAKDQNKWWSQFGIGGDYTYKMEQDMSHLQSKLDIYPYFLGQMQSHAFIRYSYLVEAYEDSIFNLNKIFIHHCMRPIGEVHYWMNVYFGDQIDYDNVRKGNVFGLNPGLNANVTKHIKIYLNYTFEQMMVNEGHLYDAHIGSLNFTYQFNRQIFLRSIFQYKDYWYNTNLYSDVDESRERILFCQYLFSYKINPQTVFFLGYSDNYFGEIFNDITQSDWAVFLKLSYAFLI